MNGINRMTLLGHLGRDPEVRRTKSDTPMVSLSVATTRTWKDKATHETHEDTEWHRVVAYDSLAQVINEYLKKGSRAYFEGRLQTRKWQDKEGQERYTTEIIADRMEILDRRLDIGGAESESNSSAF
jgi:single-strand DNA-binding protein